MIDYMIISLSSIGVRNGLITFPKSNVTMKFNTKEKAQAWIMEHGASLNTTLKVVPYKKEYESSQFDYQ